jgi:hypothetical protein
MEQLSSSFLLVHRIPGIPDYFTTTQKKNSIFQLFFSFAWQHPTLTGGNPQLPSALRSLTSVFGMGTGVTFSPSPPDYFIEMRVVPSKLDNVFQKDLHSSIVLNLSSSGS